jgi:hypothetical protein
MAMLTRDQVFGAEDIKTEVVDVPEWGGSVIVGTMTGYARDIFESQMLDKKNGNKNMRAKLAAATVQDEEGNLLFSEKDIEALGKKSGAALERIFDAALRINRIGPNDVDELAKN